MVGPLESQILGLSTKPPSGATRRTALGLILGAPLLGACAGVQQSLSIFQSVQFADPTPVRRDRRSSRRPSAPAGSRSA